MDGQTLARVPARLKLGWTPHDLRRTMATHMADMGVMPHVIEKCLNHKMAGVMAVYNRAEYAAEKKAAWQLWQRKLLRLRKKEAPGEGG
jgi:integrase